MKREDIPLTAVVLLDPQYLNIPTAAFVFTEDTARRVWAELQSALAALADPPLPPQGRQSK